MNLPPFDLNQLKDLDVSKVLESLLAHKVRALVILCAVVGVIGLLVIFNGYQARAVTYEDDTKLLKEKMDIVNRHDSALKEMKDFMAALPRPLDDEKLIDQITDYAVHSNVAILNYTPDLLKNEKLYDVSRVRLSVSAANFNDLLVFLRTIERSPYFLRVESFSNEVRDNANVNVNAASPLTAEMLVSSVHMRK